MFTSQVRDTHKVLVELSVISLNGNGHHNGQKPFAIDILEKTGLFYQQARNVICIEGEWDEISEVIHQCYDRVQTQSPQGYLQVSIR
jgi:uncharacterized protein YqgV (UPF0045/DUF77 family)